MIRLIKRIAQWFADQIVDPGPPHNHDEGEWRPDCRNCGVQGYRRWK